MKVLTMATMNHSTLAGRLGLALAASGLWLITALLGIWNMIVLPDAVVRIFARFVSESANAGARPWWDIVNPAYAYWQATSIWQWALFVLALAWIAVVIGGAEYHYRHVGQSNSWRLFRLTILVELLMLSLPLLF
jgi:hypothetical protein